MITKEELHRLLERAESIRQEILNIAIDPANGEPTAPVGSTDMLDALIEKWERRCDAIRGHVADATADKLPYLKGLDDATSDCLNDIRACREKASNATVEARRKSVSDQPKD